jgi:protein TonB
VIDKFQKKVLPFAKVKVKENNVEITCDEKGEYILQEIPKDDYTLEASSMGYLSQKKKVSPSDSIVNFSLTPIGFFDLKGRTPFYTKLSLLITLVLLIIASVFIPATQPKPLTRKVEAAVRTIELPPQLQQFEEPPPPPKLEMPVAAESEEEVEASTIDPTAGIDFEKQPPMPKTEEVYDFYAVEEKPYPVKKYYPKYPEIARKAGIEGQVMLELIVDTTGLVIDVKVVKPLYELLDAAAVKAARKWRFKPAKQRDRPVKVRVYLPVRFSLEE